MKIKKGDNENYAKREEEGAFQQPFPPIPSTSEGEW